MECEKVRDRFSSLLEKELNPIEERIIKEHLVSCSGCQRDFEQFEKTIDWLHSVETLEVPEGFLSGIYKKIEDRKRETLVSEKEKKRWWDYPLSLKLPIQAVAMVAIVFFVLYLTKMMPVEGPRLKGVEPPKPPVSEERKMEREEKSPIFFEKKSDQKLAPKEMEGKREAEKPPLETPLPKDLLVLKPSLSEEKQMEEAVVAKEKSPREIVLRTSNREKTLSQLHELLKQFGGEIIETEGNILLTSLPAASYSEFEKGLAGLGSYTKEEKTTPGKDLLGSSGVPAGVKRREVEEKGKKTSKILTDKENYLAIRIHLLQE